MLLKDLCTKKRSTNIPKKIFLDASISSILSHSILVIQKGLKSFTIFRTIGSTVIGRALLDIEANINLLPYLVYQQLELGEIRPTKIILQLADMSVMKLMGEIEDVLIKIGEFILLVDFLVLETQPMVNLQHHIVDILRRPLLATSNTIIYCCSGSIRLSFANMILDLNILNIKCQHTYPFDESLDVSVI